MGMHLPPGPSSMTSMPVLPKFQRPSNCSTVHLYHRIRNTRSVSPWDTITRFMFLELASGRWKRPTSMSDRSVSLNPETKIHKLTMIFTFEIVHGFSGNKLLFLKGMWKRNKLACYAIVNICSWFPIWKTVEETTVTNTSCLLQLHSLSILEISCTLWKTTT